MIRLAAAAVLALHGLVHAMGFAAAWRVAELEEIAYRTSLLNGLVEVGDLGARLLGLAWLVLVPAFLVAAWGVARRRPWAGRVTAVAAGASLVVCTLGLPDAWRGLLIDFAILAALALIPVLHRGGLRPAVR